MRSYFKLLGLAILAALLAGTYFAINANSDPQVSGKMYQFSSSDSINQIKVVNNYGSFTFEKENDSWMLTSPGNYQVNQQKVSIMEKFLLDMPINRILDAELLEYGLNKPVIIVEFYTKKNIHKKLYVGNLTPSKAQIYLKDAQSGKVFIVDAGSTTQFDGSLNAYRGKEIFSIDQNSISEVTYINNGTKKLAFKYFGPQNWQLTYPLSVPARNVEISEIIVKMRKWSAAGYPDTSSAPYEEFGLEDPADILILTDSNGNSQTLEFGKTEDAMIYVRTGSQEDIAKLFTVDIDFSQFTVEKLIFIAPLQEKIQNISKISIVTPEKTSGFELDHATDPITILVDEKRVSYEDFVSLYVKFSNLSADGYELGSHPGDTYLTLTTTKIDGTSTTMSIKYRDDNSFFLDISGNTDFYINKEEIDQLLFRWETALTNMD